MTKKQFITFAKNAKRHVDIGQINEALAIYHAVLEANDNPLFNTYKFRNACGITEEMESVGRYTRNSQGKIVAA